MNIEEKIETDLKQAMLAGDKPKVSALRNVKSALQYETVAQGVQEAGLNDEQTQKVLAREAKKRAEAAEAYKSVGAADRAESELAEKAIIENYLPAQASEAEVEAVVKEEIAKLDSPTHADMGKIIGVVRGRLGATADGGLIAKLVKQSLEK